MPTDPPVDPAGKPPHRRVTTYTSPSETLLELPRETPREREQLNEVQGLQAFGELTGG